VFNALCELDEIPEVICTGGWWPRDHYEYLHGSDVHVGYRGVSKSDVMVGQRHFLGRRVHPLWPSPARSNSWRPAATHPLSSSAQQASLGTCAASCGPAKACGSSLMRSASSRVRSAGSGQQGRCTCWPDGRTVGAPNRSRAKDAVSCLICYETKQRSQKAA
jgi:hypothetical protein